MTARIGTTLLLGDGTPATAQGGGEHPIVPTRCRAYFHQMSLASLQPEAARRLKSSGDPVHRTQKLKTQMSLLVDQLREDAGQVTEPKAQALFETSAEVLTGLVKAFDDYEGKREAAWQAEDAASGSDAKTTDALTR